MTLQLATRKKIDILRKEKGHNESEFADFCEIPISTMKNILSGNTKDIKSSTIWKIAYACGLNMKDFYSDPVFSNLSIPR